MSSAFALRPRHAAAVLLGLGFTGACSALPGGGGDDGGPSAITVPDNNQRVTSVLCTSPTSCVFGTDSSSGDPTHLYATDGQNVTTLVTADDAYAETVNVMGPDVPFGPLAKIGDTIFEQFLGETGFVVTAKGDPMQPGSWTTVPVGDEGGGDTWGLGAQVALANAGGKWTYFSSRQILEATTAPGSATQWTAVWAPQASPSVPVDIEDQRNFDDPTLCDTEPYIGEDPTSSQMGYVAPDRSMIAYPAGTPLAMGNDGPGMCISTDGGHSFHLGPIQGVQNGPNGVACTSKDHCVAYANVPTDPGTQPAYVWVSNDASKGATSTWTAATIPAPQSDTEFTYAFFADASHGWLLGFDDGATALLYATTDGGATWSDVSAKLGTHDALRLWAGTALDATHILVGGEKEDGSPDILYPISM